MATGTKRQKATSKQRGDELTRSSQRQTGGGSSDDKPTRSAQTRSLSQTGGQQQGGLTNIDEEQLARGLGWFSIGLGLAEFLSPRGVARIAGIRGNTTLIRLFGLREIASGVGIFMQRRPTAAVWSRVAGDALDLACLGAAFASPDSNKGRVAFATANVLTVTALDVICAQALSSQNDERTESGGTRVNKSVVIDAAPEELYNFWHDFENLPRFMNHLEEVRVTDDKHSHWVAKAPAGTTVEWDAEITDDRPNELIAWRSLEGADVYNAGSVRFERERGVRGTIVRVEIDYAPPGGVIGAAVAKLFGEEPGQQVGADLRRFKQLIETGEVVVSDATLAGTGLTEQRPAQPASEAASSAVATAGR